MLGANRSWIFINYFDFQVEKYIDQSPQNYTDYFYAREEWTPYYFNNSFTCLMILLLYLAIYTVVKLISCMSKSDLKGFVCIFEFEIGQQLLKVMHFRLAINFFLELKNLGDGKGYD